MINLFKRIKRIFLPIKSQIYTHEVISGVAELAELSDTAFNHTELHNAIHKDIIILIISNDFVAEPGMILTHFNRYYEFTIDEFVVLSYKIGMIVKMYIENPVYLLEDALNLTDVFEEASINQFKSLLDQQVVHDRNEIARKYTEFFSPIATGKEKIKLKAADIDANKKIDEWMKKNNKN